MRLAVPWPLRRDALAPESAPAPNAPLLQLLFALSGVAMKLCSGAMAFFFSSLSRPHRHRHHHLVPPVETQVSIGELPRLQLKFVRFWAARTLNCERPFTGRNIQVGASTGVLNLSLPSVLAVGVGLALFMPAPSIGPRGIVVLQAN
ncbi:hypothetical protein AUP68_03403 [Ilyonectria robusta]